MQQHEIQLSEHAEDLRGFVEQMTRSVARLGAENNAVLADIASVELDLTLQRFRDHGIPTQLADELMELYRQLFNRMDEYGQLGSRLRAEFEAKVDRLQQVEAAARGKTGALRAPGMRRKTVVQFDMAGYSTVAGRLQDNFGPASVNDLNRQIDGFLDTALRAIGVLRRRVFMAGGGDGATLGFDEARTAFGFIEQFFRIVGDHNAEIRDESLAALYRCYFRMGASTGDLFQAPGAGPFDAAGRHIIYAVRFQDGGRPGELFTDDGTFQSLTPEQQTRFEPESVEIKGKRDEQFTVHRCIFDRRAAAEAETSGLWQPKHRIIAH